METKLLQATTSMAMVDVSCISDSLVASIDRPRSLYSHQRSSLVVVGLSFRDSVDSTRHRNHVVRMWYPNWVARMSYTRACTD